MTKNVLESKLKKLYRWLFRFMGFHSDGVSHTEKLVAVLGAAVGIFFITIVSYQVTGASGAVLIVPSMGASAVLLFAVPHGRLSQPWALFGGHLSSAVVGVACFQLIPDTFLASAIAVGLAVGVMHLLGCIHPPGGATALAAVIGGPVITDLGYYYVLTPILLDVVVIFVVAVIFNGFFPWRRYPVATMMRFTDSPPKGETSVERYIDKIYIEQAVADMDLVLDVTVEDMQRLIRLTLLHAENVELLPKQIHLGSFYTNAKHGPEWCVWQIIDESVSDDPKKDMVIYRVVEGRGLRSAGSCTRAEFARRAVREVYTNAGD